MARKCRDTDKVVIVAGNDWAYDDFRKYSAYICQAGRYFCPHVDRVGYYAKYAIQREFPTILARRDHVALTQETACSLRASSDLLDAEFAKVVEGLIAEGRQGETQQIFLVSGYQDPRTLKIPHWIHLTTTAKSGSGRRVAWVQQQRYVSEAALLTHPRTTDELDARIERMIQQEG